MRKGRLEREVKERRHRESLRLRESGGGGERGERKREYV